MVSCFDIFLQVLELLRCLLAVFLAMPRLYWMALDSKIIKKNMFFKVFVNADFLALGRSCWRSWAYLGAIGAIRAPTRPQNYLNIGLKLV